MWCRFRSQTAAKARSTRCSRLAAARCAQPVSPGRSVIRSTRNGRCCPARVAVVEMARASGLALVGAGNDPLRATTRGTGELDRGRASRRIPSGDRRGGRQCDDRWRTRCGRGARLVACKVSTSPSRATSRRAFGDAARAVRTAEGCEQRAGRVAHPPARSRRGAVPARAPEWMSPGSKAVVPPVAWPAVSSRSARDSRPVSTWSPRRSASTPRSTDADLAVTGEGKLDATSLEGKVVAGVLDWCEEYGVPRVAVIVGQVDRRGTRRTLDERAGRTVLALTDRVWQARRGVRARRAPRRGSRGRGGALGPRTTD